MSASHLNNIAVGLWPLLLQSLGCLHGRYCGWGCSGQGFKASPKDALDRACFFHDKCYTGGGSCANCYCNDQLRATTRQVRGMTWDAPPGPVCIFTAALLCAHVWLWPLQSHYVLRCPPVLTVVGGWHGGRELRLPAL